MAEVLLEIEAEVSRDGSFCRNVFKKFSLGMANFWGSSKRFSEENEPRDAKNEQIFRVSIKKGSLIAPKIKKTAKKMSLKGDFLFSKWGGFTVPP